MCETLEVLKIDVNLCLDLAYIMPSFRLPNLKLLHLCVSFISEDDFVPRLVASCPVLEDLTVGLSVVELKDQLPAFRSLNHLELSQYYMTYWDKLLPFLNRSLVLETLVFPQGLIESPSFEIENNAFYITRELLELEREFLQTTLINYSFLLQNQS
uniref:F-box/LRR-repeat protein 15/At3g58940/PEG3-like LRR domain-containing protein n=1 Tax=Chenopodium quinoa TaxID=63459 RepID=A0A803MVM0_CHEQI